MNENEIKAICEECQKKTRIVYTGDGRFFQPKMTSLNYLQLGRSKMLHNPLLLLFEWFYQQYKGLRDLLQQWNQKLFPRRPGIWSGHIDSALTGYIHYADRENLNQPIHHLTVQFWGRTRWGQWRKLGDAFSDENGYFSIPFELRAARNWRINLLQCEIYQPTEVRYRGDIPEHVLQRCYKTVIPAADLTGMRYNLRTIRLHLWEYRRDTPVPRTEIGDIHKDAPQYYAQGRLDALYEQVSPLELIKIKHLEQIAYAPETISLAEIQQDYPENLTVCIEKKLPGYTRTDEWFGQRMMNGMNRGSFLPDPEQSGLYWIKYFGVCQYDHNDEYALPTVRIGFRLGDNGLPLPVEIRLMGPTNAFDKNPWQEKIFTPQSGDEWLYAKRVARVTGSFSTEVDEHFTGTHLNTEQYAIAAYRNFRRSPLTYLLFPHLKEVALVNHSADTVLIHGYIPSATALTETGLHDRTRDLLGVQDWKHWQPMRILSDAHTCAKAESLFWDITCRFVDRFFDAHLEGIKAHWYEVYQFSQDLVLHAVPVFLSDIPWESRSKEERQLAEERLAYYCFQYGFDPSADRIVYKGEKKAVSPVTMATRYEDAHPEDLAHLKKLCSYAIMMATFMHTWINEHQYDDLGEVLYSSGGLRFGNQERGILAPENDLSISPDLTRATGMLWFTNFLSRTEYGFITRNEEGDVHPWLRKMLTEQKDTFAAWGVNVDAIESRTNI